MPLLDVSERSATGVSGGYTGGSRALEIILACFLCVAVYNAIELFCLIFLSFKKFRGWYFWSLLVSTIGVAFNSFGYWLKLYQITTNNYVSVTIIIIGWWSMVNGQSMVLWSRLHLVMQSRRTLRRVRYMIIFNAIVLMIPGTVLTYASNSAASLHSYIYAYEIMEKIQLTGFCIQELIISSLYIWETAKIVKLRPSCHRRSNVLYQLIVINLAIIMMDIAILGVEYANLYAPQVALKVMVYSVKLKLEFAVLGKLVSFVKESGRGDELYLEVTSSVSANPSSEPRSGHRPESSRGESAGSEETGQRRRFHAAHFGERPTFNDHPT